MQEIKCPNCGTVFKIDESGYAQIVQQVRDKEFSEELKRRERELAQKKDSELALVRLQQERAREAELSEKDAAIAQKEQQITRMSAEKAQEIARLNAQKDLEIAKLKARLESLESSAATEKKLAVTEAVREKEQELTDRNEKIHALQAQLTQKDMESQLKEQTLKENYEGKLKLKDEQIEYYKDFKARQSTKMVGESLEQHCMNQFNSLRMTAFPNAYFEKDNDVRSGSKGDFIFSEKAEDGTEFISIMFEMKNEMDETATKHKNEDFFKELDKDRREKNCEYAVLVSMLEQDNEYYSGITDVSYRYEKMYVIRPQFFIPMITLLRNAALNSLKYRQELEVVRNQQLDLRHFEENMEVFKAGFKKNYELASRKFQEAIDDIDKTIKMLEKTKEALQSSDRNLRLANDKAQDLSIKRLTKNAPSVRAMFEEYGTEE